jgi:hypothetical protein
MDPKPRRNHEAYLAVLARMTDEQKLKKVFELSEFVRGLFLAGLRERFPTATESEIRRIYLQRLDQCNNGSF